MKRTAFFLSMALITSVAHGAPTADEVKAVIDYYYGGQAEGLLLADLKLCDEVHTQGELKNECVSTRAETNLKSGEAIKVWMMFMVPHKMEPQNIMVQLNHEGLTMAVERTQVTSAVRYRTWKTVKPDRPGEWTLKIIHDQGSELRVIKELALNVSP